MPAPDAKYEDYDWDELPNDVREAYEKLGYTEKIWDKDLEAETDDYDWEELSDEQKKAAEKLGYDKKKWEKY